MPTYEAIYEDGELEWIGDAPDPGRHRVEVTVLDQEPVSRDPEEVQRILDESHGAWDADKSVEEIDEDIEKMRSEWDRPWYDADRE
jgi:hypothetical protein